MPAQPALGPRGEHGQDPHRSRAADRDQHARRRYSTFRITQSGSYYLTGNITAASGFGGIEIDASNVTLDLMGHRVLGSLGALNGIFINGTETNLTIRNGSVRSFDGDGLAATVGDNVRVFDFTARNCGGRGVALGQGCTVTNVIADSNSGSQCAASLNTLSGLLVSAGSLVTSCSSSSNTADGIRVSFDCVVLSNICNTNGFNGTGAGTTPPAPTIVSRETTAPVPTSASTSTSAATSSSRSRARAIPPTGTSE